jgi:hypothetical protein
MVEVKALAVLGGTVQSKQNNEKFRNPPPRTMLQRIGQRVRLRLCEYHVSDPPLEYIALGATVTLDGPPKLCNSV